MGMVHVAVTRQVKPERAREFEDALRDFARESLHEPGTTGVHAISPIPGSAGCEYGILRSFADDAACQRFYQSEAYQKWQERVAPLVVGEPVRRRLHGLEAFFRKGGLAPPPRWKMALVTWLGVFPTVLSWSFVLRQPLADVPHVVLVAITNVFVVATLTWVVMPLLTRVFERWLQPRQD